MKDMLILLSRIIFHFGRNIFASLSSTHNIPYIVTLGYREGFLRTLTLHRFLFDYTWNSLNIRRLLLIPMWHSGFSWFIMDLPFVAEASSCAFLYSVSASEPWLTQVEVRTFWGLYIVPYLGTFILESQKLALTTHWKSLKSVARAAPKKQILTSHSGSLNLYTPICCILVFFINIIFAFESGRS